MGIRTGAARLATAVLALASVAVGAGLARADGPSPSAATASTVSLPDGPGSVRGLGSDAEIGVFSGEVQYDVPFSLPNGWGGFAPQLGLGYSGELGNGVVGVGWMLSHAAIRRSTREGVPSFTDDDTFEIVGFGQSGRLVPIGPDEFRIEGQGNAFRVIRNGRRFEVTDSDGSTYYMGLTSDSREQDDQGRIFAWLPEVVTHRSGESIQYTYFRDHGQVYMSGIAWGPNRRFDVALEYEARPDSFVSYREGFRVETDLRLAHVRVHSTDAAMVAHELRAYHLTYDDGLSLSRLASVTMTGYDGLSALPPLTFGYATEAPTQVVALGGTDGWQLEQRGVAFFDVDGDGMDDLYRLEMGNHEYRKNLGGTFGARTRIDGATALELASTAFIDLDGDSRPELVRIVNDTWRYSRLVDGAWQPGAVWPGTTGVPLSGPGVATADVNGDGRTDVLQSTTGGVRLWLNTSYGLASPISLPPVDPSNVLVEPGGANTRVLDMNGDGLADVVWLTDSWMKIFLGRGDGTFQPWRKTFYPWSATALDLRNLRLADLNRDGLVDLVRFTASHVLYFPGEADGSFSWFSRHVPRPDGDNTDITIAIADANGNGSQDIVWSSPRGMWVLDLAGSTSAGMLTSIDNGMGRVSRYEYSASAQLAVEADNAGPPWDSLLPVSVPVPVTARVDMGDGSPERIVHYGVRDGFWDGTERRFGGFLEGRKVLSADNAADVSQEITKFSAGLGDERVLRGKPIYVRVENGLGVVHTETWSEWAALPVDYGFAQDDPLLSVAVLREVRARNHDGVPTLTPQPIDTLTWYEYDGQGRQIAEQRMGRTDVAGDETRIERQYATDDDTRWIRDKVCTERTLDGTGTELAKTETYYGDTVGALEPLCAIGEGLTRETRGWLQEAATPHWVTLSSTSYTPHWNPAVTYADGVTHTLGYDADDFRVVSETANPDVMSSLTWTLGWDDVRGLAISSTDPAGVVTNVAYDALDRPVSLAHGSSSPYTYYQYDWSSALPLTRTFIFDGDEANLSSWSGGWAAGVAWRESVAVANGAGKPVLSAIRLDTSTWIVSGMRDRDQRGRTTRVYDAFYYDGSDIRQAAPLASTPSQTFDYDAFDRLREEVLPTGGHKSMEYWAYGQRTSGDEVDPVTSFLDGQGRITRTERTVNGTAESVDATYDGAGRLVEMALQGGQATHLYTYDTLGRMIAATDPDIGPRTLTYDDAGRLLTHINAEGQTITYAYDDIGRLTSMLADDGSAFAYHYDTALDPVTFGNTAGKLAWVQEATGQVQLGYDAYGRQTQYARSIDGSSVEEDTTYAPSGVIRHVGLDSELGFDISYDPAGRPIRITETGSVSPYGDIWQIVTPRTDLDAAGRILAEQYGNGVTQAYTRDDNGATQHIQTTRSPSETLYDVTIARNAWRGITTVTDSDGTGLAHDASFTYDGAARLTAATIGPAGPNQYAFSYQYDGLQNMVSRAASGPTALGAVTGDYVYGGSRGDGTSYGPRQLTKVTAPGDPTTTVATFDYDHAGRQTTRDGKTLIYNGLDQLTEVDGLPNGTGIVQHQYGYDGLRVKTTSTSGDVSRWYTPSIFERNGERLHYVMLGDRIIARITKTPDSGGGGAGGIVTTDARLTDIGRAVLALAALLLLLFILWRGRGTQPRWVELTAGVAIFALVQAGCGLFGRSRQYAWSNGEILYFHSGVSAGPCMITRQDGTIFAERRYEPFGTEIDELAEPPGGGTPTTGPIDYSREQYNALNKPSDPDTNWSYHGARWMAPQTARWLTPDPPVKAPDPKFMTQPWTLHPYQYVEQNPVIYWDPDGRDAYGRQPISLEDAEQAAKKAERMVNVILGSDGDDGKPYSKAQVGPGASDPRVNYRPGAGSPKCNIAVADIVFAAGFYWPIEPRNSQGKIHYRGTGLFDRDTANKRAYMDKFFSEVTRASDIHPMDILVGGAGDTGGLMAVHFMLVLSVERKGKSITLHIVDAGLDPGLHRRAVKHVERWSRKTGGYFEGNSGDWDYRVYRLRNQAKRDWYPRPKVPND